MGKIERVCKNCGKTFLIYKSALSEKTNSSGNFCCRDCYYEYMKTLTGEKNAKFNREKVKCKNCGKELLKTPSRIATYKGYFCSVKCRGEYQHNYTGGKNNCNWKGGIASRNGFATIKTLHFKNAKCSICGEDKHIAIHHIIPYKLTQDNSKENLIPLCRKHHRIIETKTNKLIGEKVSYSSIRDYILKDIKERAEKLANSLQDT